MEKTVAGVSLGSDEFAAGIRADLARVEQVIADGIAEADGCVIEEALHLFQAGGKRFRPMFTVLSGRIGGAPSDQVITAAAAMELTHLATLYHDDVMDEADTRRGAPSANARWGNSIAILAGDYLFARASAYGADLGPRAVGVIAKCFGELVTGQMLELKGAGDGDPVQHYLDTIWGKTGSLIATCGLLGALHGGASEETAQRMYRIGAAIGMAFQISDDIIDISSVAQDSGKTPGTDLREGVFTLPVLYALRDSGPEADRLREILVGPVTDDALVDEAIELLGRSAGMKEAQATLARYADDARAELAELPESEPRSSLESLVTFTVARLG
ncbi:Heptaprenyl diphosphate synthase component 2 (plasmid) [Tsukamurella tyrosinosolvens]|uniref:Heptaprenyl diphosphate synthase n=1 Tax=Tsukamurella tyrosinosolvens TaxID=57704 RepID=A0A1H4MUK4_TSUTY|nr:polyprenyl synthetase family protein [Tsukamurella tyrosinosolvens]KXO96959.1 geranylgeranyl pyrophosphate synthase [Tsukamurella tyrosinosolvens]MEC4613076.1 polyprenyl synthetase family protein [Tsukamurella tyrosinosolvens]QRY85990.1 polyprenyl synthetase family protein [Tsukamurella tyrosinosolvens]RDB49572.1 polyprenyl synthetase family protein [Tsukamurella tyrosinosolvens]SEB86761.1 heptaprenyl diphosphate synthase [Tsukamurella tyrosinosolvens]